MSAAYSLMVRSLENLPELVPLRIAVRASLLVRACIEHIVDAAGGPTR